MSRWPKPQPLHRNRQSGQCAPTQQVFGVSASDCSARRLQASRAGALPDATCLGRAMGPHHGAGTSGRLSVSGGRPRVVLGNAKGRIGSRCAGREGRSGRLSGWRIRAIVAVDLTVTSEVRRVDVDRAILAHPRPGDVIVIASHGRGGPACWFLGSVAEDVIRNATVPVLLIRSAILPGDASTT